MIVKLLRKYKEYPDLTPEQHYMVIGIEADDLRLLNDHDRPYLYPHQIFEVLDPRIPSNWITEIGENGEKYAYPPQLNSIGFFEDFFNDDETEVTIFWRVVNPTAQLWCQMNSRLKDSPDF